MCTVKPYHILNEGFRTFAVRLPSLSRGEWTWDCGITFDIFTHVYYTGRLKFIRIYTYVKEIQVGDLGDGYNAHVYKKIHGWNKLQIDDLDDGYIKKNVAYK